MSPETTFVNPFATLQLHRWPRRPNETLRAWDGADLYLLEHLSEHKATGPWLIFNDLCGALALSLVAQPVSSSGDSFMAQQALFANAQDTPSTGSGHRPSTGSGHRPSTIDTLSDSKGSLRLAQWPQGHPSLPNLSWLWPEESIPTEVATVLLRIPKSLALLEYQLSRLSAALLPGTPVILAGIDKHLPPNLLTIMARYLRNPKAGLGRHKARLFFAESEPKTRSRWPSRVKVPELDAALQVEAGVFSQDSLDLGARFFMQQIPNGIFGGIADLGCGNGVIGLVAAKRSPDAKVYFCDESAQAIKSARANAAALFPGRDFVFQLGNGLDGLDQKFELILLNPPFHRGHAIDDGVARMLFGQARAHLAPHGQLLVIGNRLLPYQQPLRRLFTKVEQLAADPRFTIWRASHQ
jgi:23S rRNA (guanine1835-N2)-methyltransferase